MIEPDLKLQSGEESNSEPASVSQLTQPQPPKITDDKGERDDDFKTNGDVSMVNQEILLKPAPEPAATTEVEPVVVSKRKSRTRATSSIAKSAAGSGRSRAGSTRRQKKASPQTVKAEISSRPEQIELQEGSTPTIPATQEDLKNNALVGVTTVVPKPTLPITETTTETGVKKEKEPNPKTKKPKSGSLKASAELIASTVPDQTNGGNTNSQSIEEAEVKMELLDPSPKNQKPIAPHPKPKPKPKSKSKPGPKPKSKPTLLGQVEQDDKTNANSEKDTDMKKPIRKRKRVSSTNRTTTTTDTTSTKTTTTPNTKQKQRKLSTNTEQQLKKPDYPPLLQKFPNLVIKTASLNSCNDTQIVNGAVTVMVDFMELAELKYGYEKVHPKFDNRLVPAIDQSAGGDGENVVKSKRGNGKNAITGIKTSGKVETRKLQQPVKRSFFVYEGVITEKVLQENY